MNITKEHIAMVGLGVVIGAGFVMIMTRPARTQVQGIPGRNYRPQHHEVVLY